MPLLVLYKMIRDASPAKALGFVGLACREEPEPNCKIKIGGKGSALSLKESVQWCDLNCTLLVFPNSIVCDGKSNHFALSSLIFVFVPTQPRARSNKAMALAGC